MRCLALVIAIVGMAASPAYAQEADGSRRREVAFNYALMAPLGPFGAAIEPLPVGGSLQFLFPLRSAPVRVGGDYGLFRDDQGADRVHALHAAARLAPRTGTRRPYVEVVAGLHGVSGVEGSVAMSRGVGAGIDFLVPERQPRRRTADFIHVGVRYTRGGPLNVGYRERVTDSRAITLMVGAGFYLGARTR